MKNLKKYEAFFSDPKYNDGEYVIVLDMSMAFFYTAKILSFHKLTEMYNIKLANNKTVWVKQTDIHRKANTEEIEKFNIKSSTNKYNL